MTVFALYYKMFRDKKDLMKFFDTKEQAETYLRSVEYWGSPFDEYNTEYRDSTEAYNTRIHAQQGTYCDSGW